VEIEEVHIIWLRDFNQHYPYWDSPKDVRLFIIDAMAAAEKLIEVVANTRLKLALLCSIPTHKHNVTK